LLKWLHYISKPTQQFSLKAIVQLACHAAYSSKAKATSNKPFTAWPVAPDFAVHQDGATANRHSSGSLHHLTLYEHR
jgi:hypothetical protein